MSESSEEYGVYSADDEDQLTPEDTLAGEEDPLDGAAYETPDHYSPDFGETPWEEERGETLDQRLAQEIPDPDPYGPPPVDRSEERPGASAEESAMHVTEEPEE